MERLRDHTKGANGDRRIDADKRGSVTVWDLGGSSADAQ